MKKCRCCKQSKKFSEFNKNSRRKDGLHPLCRDCHKSYSNAYTASHREVLNVKSKARRLKSPEKSRLATRRWELKRKYGLTVEDFDVMRLRQENKCACCGEGFAEGRIAVDHCHRTGVVRGLLCIMCNLGIGHFRDSAQRLRLAAKYMDRFEYLILF